jgi:hypothetical protein
MAAIPAADLADALNKTYRNVIGVAIGGAITYTPRLTTWRDEFFAALDIGNTSERLISRWVVPTNKLLLSVPQGSLVYASQFSVAMPIAQLVQQTIYAARFNGFTPPGALDAALTTAFNNAWT